MTIITCAWIGFLVGLAAAEIQKRYRIYRAVSELDREYERLCGEAS